MSADHPGHAIVAASRPRRAGIIVALLLTSLASTGIAQAPATVTDDRAAEHDHLQRLLWLHSPDYLLVSARPDTTPDASPRTLIWKHEDN